MIVLNINQPQLTNGLLIYGSLVLLIFKTCYYLDMTKSLKTEVSKLTEILVKKYKPEKIILFGSAARGNNKPESDLDLFVVKKTKKQYFDRVFEAMKYLNTDRSVDMIVFTPEEFEKAQNEKRVFIKQVLKYGVNLYEQTVQ